MPNVRFVKADFSEGDLNGLQGRALVFFSMPSVDTGVCAPQTNTFGNRLEAHGAEG